MCKTVTPTNITSYSLIRTISLIRYCPAGARDKGVQIIEVALYVVPCHVKKKYLFESELTRTLYWRRGLNSIALDTFFRSRIKRKKKEKERTWQSNQTFRQYHHLTLSPNLVLSVSDRKLGLNDSKAIYSLYMKVEDDRQKHAP